MEGFPATYVSVNSFTLVGDKTTEFSANRRLKANCGSDGYKYGTISSSTYSSPNTTVTMSASGDDFTDKLERVWYGEQSPGNTGTVPLHDHTGDEGDGGAIDASAHDIADHGDTTATGAELETLTDNSVADTLHRHSELVASDGSPDPAVSVGAAGKVTLINGTDIDEFSTDGTFAGNSDNAIPTEKAIKTYVASHKSDADAHHTHNTDTNLGAVSAKDPPINADKVVYRDSTDADALVTSTWTQVKAFLKTYFDTLYNKYVHPNHSGDVTSVADGAQTIVDKKVTLAKMNDMATASLIGRNTAGVGVPEVLSKATALSLLNVADGAQVNVGTDLALGAGNATTEIITSSTGNNVTLVEADTDNAGLLGADKWDEIVANTLAKHAESHTVASHSDTTGTGSELDTLTDNSIADALHRHSELVASDGAPDPAFSIDADGKGSFPTGTGINEFSIDDTLAGNSDDAVPTEQAVKAYVDNKTYLHTEAGAAATWTVNHNLGKQYVGVEVIVGGKSVAGTYDEPEITFVTVNQLTCVFAVAAAGYCHVVGGD